MTVSPYIRPGSDLEFIDEVTLTMSLENRREMQAPSALSEKEW